MHSFQQSLLFQKLRHPWNPLKLCQGSILLAIWSSLWIQLCSSGSVLSSCKAFVFHIYIQTSSWTQMILGAITSMAPLKPFLQENASDCRRELCSAVELLQPTYWPNGSKGRKLVECHSSVSLEDIQGDKVQEAVWSAVYSALLMIIITWMYFSVHMRQSSGKIGEERQQKHPLWVWGMLTVVMHNSPAAFCQCSCVNAEWWALCFFIHSAGLVHDRFPCIAAQ